MIYFAKSPETKIRGSLNFNKGGWSPMSEESIPNGGNKDGQCPYCSGHLVLSRKTLLQGDNIYWQKPWGSSLKMDTAVRSSACMDCGGVTFHLRDTQRAIREYSELSEDEKKKY